MKKELLKIRDYSILIEEGFSAEESVIKMPEEVIGMVYYLSGEVFINIKHNQVQHEFVKSKGTISSFYSHSENHIFQKQHPGTELKKVSIFLSRTKLQSLIQEDDKLAKNPKVRGIIEPTDYFVSGEQHKINPFTQNILRQFFTHKFTGVPRELFLEGQVIGLIADYLSLMQHEKRSMAKPSFDKLHQAREILLEQIDSPPSLAELSKLSGLNTYKLKTGFKELFGMPVYKYLQEKRLDKAFELIENNAMSIQEVAWYVGYESLGSFSNAFKLRFGIRPTDVKK